MSDEAESTSALNRPGVRVRLIYCVLFLFSMFLALAARGDLYPEVIETLGGGDVLGLYGVVRVGFGLSLFHGLLALAFIGYKGGDESFQWRLQNHMFCTKLTLLFVMFGVTAFIPTSFLAIYAGLAAWLAGLFLFFQVMILLSFTWQRYVKILEGDSGETIIIAASCFLYLAACVGIVFLFRWFGTKQEETIDGEDVDCFANVALICGLIVASVILTLVSIGAPEEHGWGIFPAATMVAYGVFATFSAMNSYSPPGCNALELSSASNSTSAITGFALAALTVLYSVFNVSSQGEESTGSAIGLDKAEEKDAPSVEEEEAGAATYSYTRFHLIFLCAVCYCVMLMIGWDVEGEVPENWAIDKGPKARGAKIWALFIAIALYCWTQIAPVVLVPPLTANPSSCALLPRPASYFGLQSPVEDPVYFGLMWHEAMDERGRFLSVRDSISYADHRVNYDIELADGTSFARVTATDNHYSNVKLTMEYVFDDQPCAVGRVRVRGEALNPGAPQWMSLYAYASVSPAVESNSTSSVDPFVKVVPAVGMIQGRDANGNAFMFAESDQTGAWGPIDWHSGVPEESFNMGGWLPSLLNGQGRLDNSREDNVPGGKQTAALVHRTFKVPFEWELAVSMAGPLADVDPWDDLWAPREEAFDRDFQLAGLECPWNSNSNNDNNGVEEEEDDDDQDDAAWFPAPASPDSPLPTASILPEGFIGEDVVHSVVQHWDDNTNTILMPDEPYCDNDFNKRVLSHLLFGLSYRAGDRTIFDPESNTTTTIPHSSLLSMIPSKPGFPQPFYWDEGFHLTVVAGWRGGSVASAVLDSWMALVDEDTGWVAREQVIGAEARSKVPEWAWPGITNQMNPPTVFWAFMAVCKANGGDIEILERHYETLVKTYYWYERHLAVPDGPPGAFHWTGRKGDGALDSGLDDYPRPDEPSAAEIHVDCQSWMTGLSHLMADFAEILGRDEDAATFLEDANLRRSVLLSDKLWSSESQAFFDWDGARTLDEHFGVPSTLPVCLALLSTETELAQLEATVDRMSTELAGWFGLMSLSASSPKWEYGGNYWRGNVWINHNYMCAGALGSYAEALKGLEGAEVLREKIIALQAWIRTTVVANIAANASHSRRDGFRPAIYETYHPVTGRGYNNAPFTGWTTLVLLMSTTGDYAWAWE